MRELLVALGFLLVVFAAPFGYGSYQAEVASDVLAQFSESSEVRVVVTTELTEDVLATLHKEPVQVLDDQNAIALTVTQEELSVLSANPSVTQISIDEKRTVLLQDTIGIVNIPETHALQYSGANITGSGATVCIVDTGVDFAHPDLQGRNATCNIDCVGKACQSNCSVTDDHGHGTHVAGIVAASGTLMGMAPSSKIVSVKAFDSTGGGFDADIAAGITWCKDNKDTYNISVISLSFGESGYTTSTTCDGYDLSVDAANSAAAAGIFVVAASGNDGRTNGVTTPACGSNVTAVGSVTKSLSYSSFTNRGGSHLILLAPGSSVQSMQPSQACISSCTCTGTYMTCSGTSMATPHVAGVGALFIQRYKQLYGVAPTPAFIEDALNSTGSGRFDGGTSKTYFLIDSYHAVTSLNDPQFLSIYNNKTNDSSSSYVLINETEAVLFNISVDQAVSYTWTKNGTTVSTDDEYVLTTNYSDVPATQQNVNYTLSVVVENAIGNTNTSEWLVTVSHVNAAPQFNATLSNRTFELEDLPMAVSLASNVTDIDSDESISITTNDTNITANSTAKTLTFNYSTLVTDKEVLVTLTDDQGAIATQSIFVTANDTRAPVITIVSPSNDTRHNNATINLTASVTNVSGSTVAFNYSLDGSTNFTSLVSGQTTWISTSDGTHTLNLYATDNYGNTNVSSRTFSVDTTYPQISLTEQTPLNGSFTNGSVSIQATFNESNRDWILLYVNGAVNQSISPLTSTALPVTFQLANLSDGTYNYSVFMNDSTGNSNQTETRVFFVDSLSPVISFQGETPANNSATNSTSVNITVNVTINETNVDKILFYVNGTLNQTKNSSSLVANSTTFALSNLTNGQYTYYVRVNDTANNSNQSEMRSYMVDTTNPVLAITSPANNSYTNSQVVSLNGTVSDLTNISLAVNDTRFSTNSGTNTSFNYTNSSLSEGTYSVSITATDSFGKSTTNTTTFTIDRTMPPSNISNLDTDNVTTSSINITWTEVAVTDVYEYRIYKFRQSTTPTEDDLEDEDYDAKFDADNNGTAYKKMTGLQSNTQYWFVITTIDRAGNENKTVHSGNRISETTLAEVEEEEEDTPGNTGGDETPAITVAEKPAENPKQIFSVSRITPDVPYVFSISKEEIDAMQIVIDAAEQIDGIQLMIEKLQGRPGSTVAPEQAVYSYLQIDAPALEESKLKRATIRFRVEPSWLLSHGLKPEDVVLLRYKGGAWNELETKLVDSNDKYYYYDAYTPGFSYFAISSLAKESSEKSSDDSKGSGINEAEYEAAQPSSGIPTSTLLLMAISVGVVAFGIMWLRSDLRQGRPQVLYTRPTAFINIPF